MQDNKIATVGWFDADAIELGKIQLIEGAFPKKENEIAIEESYKNLLDSEWNIGESRSVDFESGKRNFILAGIIKDYSSKWSLPAEVKVGKNTFPNILVRSSETFDS